MESLSFCAFGQDCPHHGFGCGCDMQWAHERSRLDWAIEIQLDGSLIFLYLTQIMTNFISAKDISYQCGISMHKIFIRCTRGGLMEIVNLDINLGMSQRNS